MNKIIALPRTLKQSKELGLRYYLTGKPCKYGHISKRLVSTRTCSMCENNRARTYYRSESRQTYLQSTERKLSSRQTRLKARYGLTYDAYEKILTSQNNKCAICQADFIKELVPHVDHDHQTKQVRGLLCNSCNTLLGHAKEKVGILKEAIRYLRRYVTKT